MPEIRRGAGLITDIRRGTTPIVEVRRGTTLLWTRSGTIFDNFERDDADNLGTNWTDLSSGTSIQIGIEDGAARVQIPDLVLDGIFSFRSCKSQWNVSLAGSDDGYVECMPSTKGSGGSLSSIDGYETAVYGRGSNGTTASGTGILMRAGQVYISRRLSNNDQRMTAGVPFQAGDRLRLTYVNRLNRLFKNGSNVLTWDDTGNTAAKGAGNRALTIKCEGAKDLFGPRRYSPALDYVLMG